MTAAAILKRLEALEQKKEETKQLPWDCKNLMERFKLLGAEQEILYKLSKIRGENPELPKAYRLEVENQIFLSREAREFLSLSAEKQREAVDFYYPPGPPLTEAEKEELNNEILEQLYEIRSRQGYNDSSPCSV